VFFLVVKPVNLMIAFLAVPVTKTRLRHRYPGQGQPVPQLHQ
jgi:hypothetical protein